MVTLRIKTSEEIQLFPGGWAEVGILFQGTEMEHF